MDADAFARLFAAQYADFADDLPLWRRLARESGDPILELGCGAGRVLRALAEDGFAVTGVDHNPAMLRRARHGPAPELQGRVCLVEQDLRSLDLASHYRLILAPCNTLASLPDLDLAHVLARLRAHLERDGRLAFEAPLPAQAQQGDETNEPLAAFIEPESGHPVQVYAEERAHPARQVAEVTWRYDELHADGTVQSWSLPTTFHLRSASAYRALLEQAGFREVSLCGGYSLEPCTEDDLFLIVLASG